MMSDPVWCEQCQARGKRRQLVLYQWSSDEAFYMCQDDSCPFPVGRPDMFKYTIVRNSNDLVSQRRKKRKSSLPPVTNHNPAAPTPPIICNGSPPSTLDRTFQTWKKPLPLKLGEISTPNGPISEQLNGARLGSAELVKFAVPGQLKQNLNTITTASNDMLKLPPSPVACTDVLSQGHNNKDLLSMFSDSTDVLLSGGATDPCDWDLNLDDFFPPIDDSTPLDQVVAMSPSVLKNSTLTTEIPGLQQPSEPVNIAPHLLTDSEGASVVKQAPHSECSDSSMSQEIHKPAKCAIVEECSSPVLEKDSTIQWTNAHSLCWLDSAMCMLVHSRTLREQLSQLNGHGESIVKTLHATYQQAQEVLSNYQKGRKTPSTEGLSSVSRLSQSKVRKTPNGEELDCVKNATQILHDVRQKVFDSLRPTMRCELGKNESPVFALPLLLRENTLIEDLFRLEYDWVFECDKCGFTKSDRATRVLPTLPSVTSDFSLLQACHLRSCFSCGAPGQKRRMVFHRLPPFVMLHFVTGLSHNNLHQLDFRHEDRQYKVSAVIRYRTDPDHFVAYIRDTQGDRWLQCDDLNHPVCRWQHVPPTIPPSQIHIVAWELQSCDPTANSTSLSVPPVESSTSRSSLLSESGSSSRRSTRRNSASSECSSLSSLQYNIDTVDLTLDMDSSSCSKNACTSSTKDVVTTNMETETVVRRLSVKDLRKVDLTFDGDSSSCSKNACTTSTKDATTNMETETVVRRLSVKDLQKVDLTMDGDLSSCSKNACTSSTKDVVANMGTETSVRRLSVKDPQKGAVAGSTGMRVSPTVFSQNPFQTEAKQPSQLRKPTTRGQLCTAKTGVARNLFTEKPPSPPVMCVAPLPKGKALSPKSHPTVDTNLEHVSSQPNLSKAAPILRSPNSAFTVYNGCGPRKSAKIPSPTVDASNTVNKSSLTAPVNKNGSCTVDAYTRQIVSSSKVKAAKLKVKSNTIRHMTQDATASAKPTKPSVQNGHLLRPKAVLHQSSSAIFRRVQKNTVNTSTADSVSKARKRPLSTGTGPSKRSKVSMLQNSTSTAPSSPVVTALGQKSQTDKLKVLNTTSASRLKISQLLGNKQFAGYQPKGVAVGNMSVEKRSKVMGQIATLSSKLAPTKTQNSRNVGDRSQGLQRNTPVSVGGNVAKDKKTGVCVADNLLSSSTASLIQDGRRDSKGERLKREKVDKQDTKQSVGENVLTRAASKGDNCTSSEKACSQSNKQCSPQANKKRLSETMSELCEKLGLPSNNVKMDSPVEDHFFDSFFDGDKSIDNFEISPSKNVLCLVADDNINESEFCHKLSAIANVSIDSNTSSPASCADSNHNRVDTPVARHITVSTTNIRDTSPVVGSSVSALMNKVWRTQQESPASLQRKGQFTVAQLLKQRTV